MDTEVSLDCHENNSLADPYDESDIVKLGEFLRLAQEELIVIEANRDEALASLHSAQLVLDIIGKNDILHDTDIGNESANSNSDSSKSNGEFDFKDIDSFLNRFRQLESQLSVMSAEIVAEKLKSSALELELESLNKTMDIRILKDRQEILCKLEEKERQLALLSNTIETEKSKNLKLEHDILTMNNSMKSENADLQNKIDGLLKDIDEEKLISNNHKSKTEKIVQENLTLTKNISILESKVATTLSEIEHQKQFFDEYKSSKVKELLDTKTELSNKITSIESIYSTKLSEADHLSQNHIQQLADIRKENDDINELLQSSKALNQENEVNIKKLTEAIKKHQNEIKSSEKKYSDYQLKTEKKVESMEADYKSKLQQEESKLIQANQHLNKSLAKITDLETSLSEANKLLASTQEKLDKNTLLLATQQAEQIITHKRSIEVEALNTKLVEKEKDLIRREEIAKHSTENLERKLTTLKASKEALQSKADSIEAELEVKEREIASSIKAQKKLERELNVVKKKLDATLLKQSQNKDENNTNNNGRTSSADVGPIKSTIKSNGGSGHPPVQGTNGEQSSSTKENSSLLLEATKNVVNTSSSGRSAGRKKVLTQAEIILNLKNELASEKQFKLYSLFCSFLLLLVLVIVFCWGSFATSMISYKNTKGSSSFFTS